MISAWTSKTNGPRKSGQKKAQGTKTISLNKIKRIARNQVRKSKNLTVADFEVLAKRWWSEKYNLPINHPLLLELTLEELFLEYWIDVFSKDPKELEKFENELNLLAEDSDLAWFKEMLGDQFKEEEDFSTEVREKIAEAKQGKTIEDEEITKIKEFEEDFEIQTLGNIK